MWPILHQFTMNTCRLWKETEEEGGTINAFPFVHSLLVCSGQTYILPANWPEGQVTCLNGLPNLDWMLESSGEPGPQPKPFQINSLRVPQV